MITEEHIAFARALVALARQHGMNHIHATFDMSASKGAPVDVMYAPVKLNWSQGRHGSKGNIHLEGQVLANLSEKPAT